MKKEANAAVKLSPPHRRIGLEGSASTASTAATATASTASASASSAAAAAAANTNQQSTAW